MHPPVPGASRHRTHGLILLSAFFASALILLISPVSAAEYTFPADADAGRTAENAFEDFADALPDELREEAGVLTSDGETLIGRLSLPLWLGKIADIAFSSIGRVCRAVIPLFSMVLLTAASDALLTGDDGMRGVFAGFSSLACTAELFGITSAVLADAQAYLTGLCGIMNLFLPVMETVCLMGGNLTEKAVSGGGMLLLVTLVGNFTDLILAPMVSLLFIFTAVSSSCPGTGIAKTAGEIRKCIGRLWSVFAILFSFLLSVQTVLAKSADSLGARTARFALGSFVPVAGGMLAEALSTVRAGMTYIRHASGIGGIIVLLCLFLPAVIPLLLYRLALSLTASAAELLGVTSASGIIGEVKGIVELMIGAVIAASLLFLIALLMFLKVQGG